MVFASALYLNAEMSNVINGNGTPPLFEVNGQNGIYVALEFRY